MHIRVVITGNIGFRMMDLFRIRKENRMINNINHFIIWEDELFADTLRSKNYGRLFFASPHTNEKIS